MKDLCIVSGFDDDPCLGSLTQRLTDAGLDVAHFRDLRCVSQQRVPRFALLDLRSCARADHDPTFTPYPFGPFWIQGELGRGSYGRVLEAVDTQRARKVALKLPHQEALQDPSVATRFEREVQALRTINSPFICQHYGHGSVDGQIYLAMEMVEGITLEDHVAERGPLRAIQVCELLEGLTQAVQSLERAGLVHRDIKPANIILRDGNTARPVLADFGLARPESAPHVTQTQMVMGSPGYLAPEVLLGAEYDTRSDLFALGMVARFATTGCHYQQGVRVFKLLNDMCERGVDPIDTGFPPMTLLLNQLTHSDPEHRPSRARILLQRLDQIRNSPCASCLERTASACETASWSLSPKDCPKRPTDQELPLSALRPA